VCPFIEYLTPVCVKAINFETDPEFLEWRQHLPAVGEAAAKALTSAHIAAVAAVDASLAAPASKKSRARAPAAAAPAAAAAAAPDAPAAAAAAVPAPPSPEALARASDEAIAFAYKEANNFRQTALDTLGNHHARWLIELVDTAIFHPNRVLGVQIAKHLLAIYDEVRPLLNPTIGLNLMRTPPPPLHPKPGFPPPPAFRHHRG